MKQVVLNIEDRILEEFRVFKINNKDQEPRYLILDKDSYRLLKEQFDVPEYEDLATYYGWMLSLVPEGQTKIEFI